MLVWVSLFALSKEWLFFSVNFRQIMICLLIEAHCSRTMRLPLRAFLSAKGDKVIKNKHIVYRNHSGGR